MKYMDLYRPYDAFNAVSDKYIHAVRMLDAMNEKRGVEQEKEHENIKRIALANMSNASIAGDFPSIDFSICLALHIRMTSVIEALYGKSVKIAYSKPSYSEFAFYVYDKELSEFASLDELEAYIQEKKA